MTIRASAEQAESQRGLKVQLIEMKKAALLRRRPFYLSSFSVAGRGVAASVLVPAAYRRCRPRFRLNLLVDGARARRFAPQAVEYGKTLGPGAETRFDIDMSCGSEIDEFGAPRSCELSRPLDGDPRVVACWR